MPQFQDRTLRFIAGLCAAPFHVNQSAAQRPALLRRANGAERAAGRTQTLAAAAGWVHFVNLSCDNDRYTKGHLKRGEQFQTVVWHFDASVITVGAIAAEHIDFVLLL